MRYLSSKNGKNTNGMTVLELTHVIIIRHNNLIKNFFSKTSIEKNSMYKSVQRMILGKVIPNVDRQTNLARGDLYGIFKADIKEL